MNELNIERTTIPAFLLKNARRQQAAQLDAFKDAVRNTDITWVVADYPADRACTLKDCLGAQLARLHERIGKTLTAR